MAELQSSDVMIAGCNLPLLSNGHVLLQVYALDENRQLLGKCVCNNFPLRSGLGCSSKNPLVPTIRSGSHQRLIASTIHHGGDMHSWRFPVTLDTQSPIVYIQILCTGAGAYGIRSCLCHTPNGANPSIEARVWTTNQPLNTVKPIDIVVQSDPFHPEGLFRAPVRGDPLAMGPRGRQSARTFNVKYRPHRMRTVCAMPFMDGWANDT
jgi:hypothetical protein